MLIINITIYLIVLSLNLI